MRFTSLAMRNVKEIYRDPLSVGMGIAMPIGLLVLFLSIGKNVPNDTFTVEALTPAITIFAFAFLTMFSATLLAKDRQQALLTRLLATPLRPSGFILAYSLPYLPIAVAQICCCFAAGFIFGLPPGVSVLVSLVVLIPAAGVFIGIGMTLGSLGSEGQVAALGSIIIVVTSLFSGAWMDLKLVGGVFETLGYALPFAHAIDAARIVIAGGTLADAATNLIVVYGYAAIFLFAGVMAFRWKTRA